MRDTHYDIEHNHTRRISGWAKHHQLGPIYNCSVRNRNSIIGNYKVSSSVIPAYYDLKKNSYLRVNFVNSIKQSFLVWINGTSLDLRYVLMRSSSPTKYAYGDEHYRIKFKDSTVESPCSLDNIIVHKGFFLNFELFLNENVDCRWCCSKQEQKQGKKQNKTKQTTNARLITHIPQHT